ncbi:glycoside hydrolase family 28 protein [bacterium]|nr:glycoside hydrolase family 28 protein [bacterium]
MDRTWARMSAWIVVILAGWSWVFAAESAKGDRALNVREWGATGDGVTLETGSLQRAIDACSERGGGSVILPAGDYLTGTLVLRSGVTLVLEAGCTVWGSTDLAHYPKNVPQFRSYTDEYTIRSLIYAESVEDVAIVGRGVINGNGRSFKGEYHVRPYLMRFVTCRRVTVEGITLRDSPMWVQHYLACEDVRISGVTVKSPDANYNNDGIDIDSCRRVLIEGCNIHSEDDAICLKSTSDLPCRDVVVTNCILQSRCNAFKLGTESVGGFRNIAISNSTVVDTRLSGVAIETVDGGDLERIVVTNLAMENVGSAIFIRRGARLRPYTGMTQKKEKPGLLRDVVISNITARRAGDNSCPIAGLPGFDVENVVLSHLILEFNGGGTDAMVAREIPEQPANYPEFTMFGRLPAYGFYARHARGLRMDNVQLRYAGRRCARPSSWTT